MSRHEGQDLRARWETPDGRACAKTVIRALKRGRLHEVGFLQKYNGRWDLRGLALPRPTVLGRFRFGPSQVERVRGVFFVRKASLVGVDLSFSDLSDSAWSNCTLDEVILQESTLVNVGFWGCTLRSVDATRADLRNASMGGVIRGEGNGFIDCRFIHSDLRDTSHANERYQRCDFSHAKLKEVDFDGARFEECCFAGVLDSVAFRGCSRFAGEESNTRRREAPLNPMRRVDFSQAVLRGVDFDGVDLSTCIFPDDGQHLVIWDQHRVFRQAREFVLQHWSEEDRRVVVDVLDGVYLDPAKLSGTLVTEAKLKQPIEVVNLEELKLWFGSELGARVFALLEDQCRLKDRPASTH